MLDMNIAGWGPNGLDASAIPYLTDWGWDMQRAMQASLQSPE